MKSKNVSFIYLFFSFLVGGVGVLSFCYSAITFFSTRNFRELNYLKYGPPRYPFGRAETRDPVSG
jgi:hypothetical protein